MRVFSWKFLKDNKALRIIFEGKIVLFTILILSLNLFAQTKFDGEYKGYITGDLDGGIEFTINNDYYNNIEGEFWLSGDREHFKIIYGRVTDNGKVEAYLYDKKEYLTTSFYRGYFVGEFNGKWFQGTWTFDDTTSEKREASKGAWATTSSIEATHRKYSVKVLSGHAFVSQESKFSRENIAFKDDDIYEGKWTELHRGDTMKFEPFFVVRTPPESRAGIIDPNETTLTFNNNTFAQFFYNGNIRVSRGEAHIFIAKDGSDYQVETPSGDIHPLTVVKKSSPNLNRYQFSPITFSSGADVPVAEFVVKVDSYGTTNCLVLNGAIDVSDSKKQKTVRLLKNQSVVIKTGSPPSIPVTFNQNTIDRWWEKDESSPTNSITTSNSKILDPVLPGSLAKWTEIYNPTDMNPKFSFEEIVVNGATAIRTRAIGNTLASCEIKWIKRIYETGLLNSSTTALEVAADFSFNGTTYNLPSIAVELLDENGRSLGNKQFFGKNVIGSFNRSQLQSTKHIELNSDKGIHNIPLSQIGANIKFSKLAVYLMNYTCQGENSIIFKRLEIKSATQVSSTGDAITLKNLALNRPAQQSSTSEWSNPNDAQGAVNGIKNGSFGFHTNTEKNPWWQVDLGEIKQLSEIRIFNRLDYNPERARTIQVLLSNDGSNWTRVFTNNSNIFGGNDGKPLKVSLTGKSARYVRLQLAETNYFHLDEVEIY